MQDAEQEQNIVEEKQKIAMDSYNDVFNPILQNILIIESFC